jgi:hypothetical protein
MLERKKKMNKNDVLDYVLNLVDDDFINGFLSPYNIKDIAADFNVETNELNAFLLPMFKTRSNWKVSPLEKDIEINCLTHSEFGNYSNLNWNEREKKEKELEEKYKTINSYYVPFEVDPFEDNVMMEVFTDSDNKNIIGWGLNID